MSYHGIYEDVNNLVEKHNTRDPHDILIDRGVYVRPFKDDTKLLGMFKRILNDRYIFYNPKINEYNLRMVLAHELGHDFYHGDDCFAKNELFSVTNAKEVDANVFAAHLLITDESIKEYIDMGYSIQQMANMECVNSNLIIIKLQDLMRMKIIPKINLSNNNDFFRDINGKDVNNWGADFQEEYNIQY